MSNAPRYHDFLDQNRNIKQTKEIFEQRIHDATEVYHLFYSEFKRRNCPICGHKHSSIDGKFNKTYTIHKCDRCTSLFVNPCPNEDALTFYYNSCKSPKITGEILRSKKRIKGKIISGRVHKVVDIIKLIIDRQEKARILEVGCSSGAFIAELNQELCINNISEQCSVMGIDIDRDAVLMPVKKDLSLKCSSVEQFLEENQSQFDLVVHFELIEHLTDPFKFMTSVHNLLAPNGFQHFTTPNGMGFDNVALGYNSYRPLAHSIFPPMHLQAFSTQNIIHFCIRSGFSIVELITPGVFDVDITRRFVKDQPSPFSKINQFTMEQLAIVQGWLINLSASSHMSCTLSPL